MNWRLLTITKFAADKPQYLLYTDKQLNEELKQMTHVWEFKKAAEDRYDFQKVSCKQ